MIIPAFLRLLLRRPAERGLRRHARVSTALLLAVCVLVAAPGHARSILVVGDSISAAYGMDLEQGWVALLQEKLDAMGADWQAVNASISGDTTGGGLRRLPTLLDQHKPDVVIIELGGNDGLRGYPIKKMRDNLTRMTQLSVSAGAEVLLLSMEVPPNLGRRYTSLFRESFGEVAGATGQRAAPFMLDGIATDSSLMQRDRIHPTIEAQPLILANVWPFLEPLLASR